MAVKKGGRKPGPGASYEHRANAEEVEEIRSAGYFCGKREAGRILGYHPDYLVRLAAKGKIPGGKIGNTWRFPVDDIIALASGR